jgi:hypothetical protein
VTGRIISITLPAVPAGVTGFTLEFSVDGQGWTAFSPTSLTPADFEDPDALLALPEGAYLIDGINDPVGNAEAATAYGNRYRLRWVSATGYSNAGKEFWVPYRIV